ncbi:MAG: hypothetical protein CBD16_01655 [Betaproteobacteria bacterium TMED156]|nr:MAG: hypothetical protein CBD16_01655 [Betaproteobacteria bacterium TMED156]|tara:strand:+ start:130 stop:1206 length:1077 start_codon:yes stop_codon:yes gene_type:complete
METYEKKDPDWTRYKADSKRIMAVGSKSFFAASRLFPERLSTPATIIYAYCRLADDLVDYGGGFRAIDELNDRLDAIYSGKPKNLGVDRDFAQVVKTFKIPIEYPKALIEGFLWDVQGRKYQNIDQLCDYSARVAGSVGAMIALVMRVRDTEVIARACELGIAMQLTNIARDVGEDAKMGRLYLPTDWFFEEKIDPENWLKNPGSSIKIKRIIKKLLSEADKYYQRSDEAITVLPRDCRRAIYAARLIYAEIGHKIEEMDHDSVNNRAVVAFQRKLILILLSYYKSLLPNFYSSKSLQKNALESIKFLIEPVKNLSKHHRCSTRPLNFFQRVNWVIDLFVRLEARDRYQLADPRHPPR